MSSASLINGVEGQLTDCSQINWKKARKIVRNLRQRIFRARKLGQWKQLRRLQKLLICFLRLKGGRDTWVLDADIKGFFDNVAHESIFNMIGSFPRGELIKEWLKAGFIDEGVHNPTETGTPQGGVISPLLANIGLHGLEEYVKTISPKLGIIR